MNRITELWVKWLQEQPTRVIEELLDYGRAELDRRDAAQAARAAVDRLTGNRAQDGGPTTHDHPEW